MTLDLKELRRVAEAADYFRKTGDAINGVLPLTKFWDAFTEATALRLLDIADVAEKMAEALRDAQGELYELRKEHRYVHKVTDRMDGRNETLSAYEQLKEK